MFQCKNCGERMIGNGISVPYHCPNAKDEDFDYIAPDEQVVYCKNDDNKENRMENIKYEAMFGDQSLFDGAPDDVDLIGHSGGHYKNTPNGILYCGGCTFTADELRNTGFIAMRRIIKTPVWTVADQKAGLLPEVGSTFTYKNESLTCHFIDCDGEIWAHDINDRIVTPWLKDCQPIETPAEKSARLREEWKNNVIEIHHGKRRKMSTSTFLLDDIYDALLSGELAAPKRGE